MHEEETHKTDLWRSAKILDAAGESDVLDLDSEME